VADAAEAGDELARDVMRTAGWYLGVGLVNLIHIFNPELIVIGGGVSNAGDLLLGPARQVVAERAMKDMKVRIALAELGDDPGLLGAVALVLESGV
jgi:glucokinase